MSQKKVVLWKLDTSPPSWAIRMLGDIIGVQFDYRDIDFMALEHKSPQHKKLNPMGTVPVIQDGDFVISESHTIMKYLLEKYGSSEQKERLYPSELRARALVDQAMFFDTGVVFIRVKIIALPSIFEGLQGLTPKLVEQVEDAYSIVDSYLERNKYIAADHLTLADLSLGTSVYSLHSLHPVDAKKFPRTLAWLARLAEEPYFKNITLPGAQLIAKVMRERWEKNKKA